MKALLMGLTLLPLTAPRVLAAQPSAPPLVPSVAPHAAAAEDVPAFTAADWLLSTAAGDVGLVVGVLDGGFLGVALTGPCDEDGCGWKKLGSAALGAMVVSPVTTATGVYLYGELRGHDGSYWAALGGSLVGGLMFTGVVLMTDDDDVGIPLRYASALIFPALASTVMYWASRRTTPRRSAWGPAPGAGGGLVGVDVDGTVRLGVPDVRLTLDRSGTAATVVLLSGAL